MIPTGVTVGANALTIWSAAATDAKANADGTATAARAPPSGTNIGAAIAINLANVTNSATVAGTANGPTTVKALVTSTGDGRDDLEAKATAGAGGGSVGIAGSFALNIANLTTDASLAPGGTINAGSATVTFLAASNAKSQHAFSVSGSHYFEECLVPVAPATFRRIVEHHTSADGDHRRELADDEPVAGNHQQRICGAQLRKRAAAWLELRALEESNLRHRFGGETVQVHAGKMFQRLGASEQL